VTMGMGVYYEHSGFGQLERYSRNANPDGRNGTGCLGIL
jgi:hypothetical protein